MRTFLAIPCAAAVSQAITQLVGVLGDVAPGVKWVAPENLHVTLKFFGETDDHDLVAISRAVEPVVAATAPIFIRLATLGAFPADDRPRTLWVGMTAGAEPLIALQEQVDRALGRQGYPRERRKFHPHLTIGRVRDGRDQQPLAQGLQQASDFVAGECTVDEVELISSELRPAGPIYTTLARFPMRG